MKDKKKEDSKCYGVKSREVLVPIPVCKMFQDIQKCFKISKLFIEGSLRILRRFYIWGYMHDNANTCVHRISEFDAKILNLCTLVLLYYENTRLLLQWSSGLMVHWSNIHVPDCRKCSSMLVWIYVSSIKPQILALNSFLLQVSFLPLTQEYCGFVNIHEFI